MRLKVAFRHSFAKAHKNVIIRADVMNKVKDESSVRKTGVFFCLSRMLKATLAEMCC
jgi:hypothetical protein